MDSFHNSRGRILFDAFCAFGISASLAGAWQQTYASALLGAAGFAGLFGLVRAFDLVRRKPVSLPITEAIEPPRESDLAKYLAADEGEREPAKPVDKSEIEAGRAAKKPSKKRSKRPVEAPAPAQAEAAPDPAPEIAASVTELGPELTPADPMPDELPHHPPIAPLFEPEPFVRQHRAAFGRKAR